MQSTSFAPLLSATRSRVSCWIMSSPSPLEDLDQPPALELRQRSGLLHAHAVARVALVVLVVHVELGRAQHRLAVERVTDAIGDLHHGGLVHRGRRDDALAQL